MATIAFSTLGLLIAILLFTVHKLWRVYRRGRMREKEVATKLMESTWRRPQTSDEEKIPEP